MKSMPTPGTTCCAAEQVGDVAVAGRPLVRDGLLQARAPGQFLPITPREDDVGGVAEDPRAEHAAASRWRSPARSRRSASARCGAQPGQQPFRRGAEGHRLLGRHARCSSTAGPAGPAHGGARHAGRVTHRCSARLPCPWARCDLGVGVMRRLRRLLGFDDLGVGRAGLRAARRAVPIPTIAPSSSTMIWSASMMVETRWATITTAASAVTGRSAARSRASVARSSAENESSNR